MSDFIHASIVMNIREERYHPMPFRCSPRPSDDLVVGKLCRHKSIGHHTVGFATLEEAETHICDNGWHPTYAVEAWDGVDVPASICDLPHLEACPKPAQPVKKKARQPTRAEQIKIAEEGGDAFKGVSTGFMLQEWRNFIAAGYAYYIEMGMSFDDFSQDQWDVPDEETYKYMKVLKTALDARPHLPNKAEGKELRRAKAKEGV